MSDSGSQDRDAGEGRRDDDPRLSAAGSSAADRGADHRLAAAGSSLDDGGADPRLTAALAAEDGSPAAWGEVLAALATARVFLALSADALATEPSTVPGLRSESAAQMSLLSLVSPRGARALPAFLVAHDVQRWRPEARPVRVTGPSACRAVLDDGADALLLDPGGHALAVTGVALGELAAGRVMVPGAPLSTRTAEVELVAGLVAPPGLVAALSRALMGEPVDGARLLAGPDGPVLGVVTVLSAAGLAALAARVRLRLGTDLPPSGLDLAAVAPGGPGEQVPLERARSARRFGRRRH